MLAKQLSVKRLIASARLQALSNARAMPQAQFQGQGAESDYSELEIWNSYGSHVFKGATSEHYLKRHKLPTNILSSSKWTTDGSADKVANAVLDWARDNNVSSYCHWFQPMGSAGIRHGQTGQVHNHLVEFDKNNAPVWKLKGKQLLTGETDGSSYPNGGMRATHKAGGYVIIDPTSPMFIRGDTLYIPSCLASYDGKALDEKLPLLRAMDALSNEGTRLLKHLGYNVKSVFPNIGLEQEFFLVPRDGYVTRSDLQLAGRTIAGKMPPRGQEMSDHYMSALSASTPAFSCMQNVQHACYMLGIPLRTRHREVAPGQYEAAPMYGPATQQIDQNLMVMQILEEAATEIGLAALMQEKPFHGMNGSGKHNNWSLATDDGTNLLNVKELERKTGSGAIFPVIMAAILKAVFKHGDLMRLSVASPGNDFRLGACEAPPAIISSHLGEDMTSYLEAYKNGEKKAYSPGTKRLNLGASVLPPLEVPAEDRNRTSPFPYGGHRFEFRAVGSSQNVSLVNTVLATITADVFREFSEAIEKGETAQAVAQRALTEAWPVIFNGNNYDAVNQDKLTESGLWRIDSGVDAICRLTEPKNVELFGKMKVLDAEECAARQTVMLNHYIGIVEVEANCMMEMLQQQVLPAAKDAHVAVDVVPDLENAIATLRIQLAEFHSGGSLSGTHASFDKLDEATKLKLKAQLARKLRLETMVEIRKVIDDAEAVIPANRWDMATYKDLLFLDQTHMGGPVGNGMQG